VSDFGVLLDLDRCQGYANCVIAAPAIFDIDDQTGTAILLQERPGADERSAAEEAVRQCPAEAISLDES
jgi:ferredoxin